MCERSRQLANRHAETQLECCTFGHDQRFAPRRYLVDDAAKPVAQSSPNLYGSSLSSHGISLATFIIHINYLHVNQASSMVSNSEFLGPRCHGCRYHAISRQSPLNKAQNDFLTGSHAS
ncbi:protein of unknown function [Paraburkholderia kururiensis]